MFFVVVFFFCSFLCVCCCFVLFCFLFFFFFFWGGGGGGLLAQSALISNVSLNLSGKSRHHFIDNCPWLGHPSIIMVTYGSMYNYMSYDPMSHYITIYWLVYRSTLNSYINTGVSFAILTTVQIYLEYLVFSFKCTVKCQLLVSFWTGYDNVLKRFTLNAHDPFSQRKSLRNSL